MQTISEKPQVPVISPLSPQHEAVIKKLGLIAGEGELPMHIVHNAQAMGIEVVVLTLGYRNAKKLKALCQGKGYDITPGLLAQNLALLRKEEIQHLVFAGKVDKWLLFRKPKLDERALQLMKTLMRKNDDALMLRLVNELSLEGITVVPQTAYLQNLFLPAGLLTPETPLSLLQEADIQYGFELAKSTSGLDIGQSVVVHQGMAIAIEAIEGTDECIRRAGKLTRKKGGTLVKVAKPNQDQRFDVPTVGLRTLQTMKKMGLTVLATEANETLYIDLPQMQTFARQHGMSIVSVSPQAFAKEAEHVEGS